MNQSPSLFLLPALLFALSIGVQASCQHLKAEVKDPAPMCQLPSTESKPPDAGFAFSFQPVDAGRGYVVGWLNFTSDVSDASAKGFSESLEKMIKQKPDVVVIELRTNGGSVPAGLDMAKEIERLDLPTVCVADGDVASEGAFLLQACDIRIMTDRSLLMVHQPYLRDQLVDAKVQQLINRQQRITWAWTQHVGRRWKISPDELRKRIRLGNEWWMTAPEALEVGAVDAVVPDIRVLVKDLQNGLVLPAGLVFPEKN